MRSLQLTAPPFTTGDKSVDTSLIKGCFTVVKTPFPGPMPMCEMAERDAAS